MKEGPRGPQDLQGPKRIVSIVGAGPGALMLAAYLNPEQFRVAVYEQNAAAGRKFLVAGDGGLNLTHSEDPARFIERYTPPHLLRRSFSFFNNHDLVRSEE